MKEGLYVIFYGGVILVGPLIWILTRQPDKKSKYLKIYCGLLFTPIAIAAVFAAIEEKTNSTVPVVSSPPPAIQEPTHYIVQNKEIYIGMDQNTLLRKWGKPDKINSMTNAYGVNEQWIYGEYVPVYVYLDNQIITSWQESK